LSTSILANHRRRLRCNRSQIRGSLGWRRCSFSLAHVLVIATGLADCRAHHRESLQVAAAADLSSSFEEAGKAYEARTGERVVFSFGATGLLERQVAEGAPFDVFAAADVSSADSAIQSGACLADSKAIYATGRLALFSPQQAPRKPMNLTDLVDSRIVRIAIANPLHAPYGRAAKQAMERSGVWALVKAKVVYGENVRQALQFAQAGNADVAIVALSLARTTAEPMTPIPDSLYDPITQALVVCSRGKAGIPAARKFVQFIESNEGRAILRKDGFLVPGDSTSTAGQAMPPAVRQ